MFNLCPSPTFTAPVPLSVPGLREPLEVNFTFKHLPRTALEKWINRYVSAPGHEALAEVITGWDMRRDGQAVDYSVSALAELCEAYTPARGEISDAYILELTRAKRKN